METAKNNEAINPRARKITPAILERIRTANYDGYIHVITWNDKWRVIKHGKSRAIGTYNDENTAIAIARKSIGSLPGRKIVVHGQDGEVVQVIDP